MTPPRWCEMTLRLGKRSMMPEKTSRPSAAPVSNGQPITLQIFVFRRRLAAVVRHLARSDRMQQDRPTRLLDDLVDRKELILVDGGAVDIGVQLDRVGAIRQHALGLPGGRLG